MSKYGLKKRHGTNLFVPYAVRFLLKKKTAYVFGDVSFLEGKNTIKRPVFCGVCFLYRRQVPSITNWILGIEYLVEETGAG